MFTLRGESNVYMSIECVLLHDDRKEKKKDKIYKNQVLWLANGNVAKHDGDSARARDCLARKHGLKGSSLAYLVRVVVPKLTPLNVKRPWRQKEADDSIWMRRVHETHDGRGEKAEPGNDDARVADVVHVRLDVACVVQIEDVRREEVNR